MEGGVEIYVSREIDNKLAEEEVVFGGIQEISNTLTQVDHVVQCSPSPRQMLTERVCVVGRGCL